MESNSVALSGRIAEIKPLRYTPAGIAVLEFRVSHTSWQIHGGMKRQAECEIQALALDEAAKSTARLNVGASVKLTGFLARRSKNSTQLVLHVNNVELE
ncbi:MAG TPA: primosomal replication protein N [Burkholderiales bacterium]|nr:primosomal replication protein N [Burkholderiales bacterium]